MIEERAHLKKTDGTILATIPLPRSAADISLMRYISFLTEIRKLELPDANPMQVMAQAVAEVSGVDIGEILLAKVGEKWQHDKQLDGGVRSFYGWFTNAMTNYKGGGRTAQNFEFQYKGETYRIPYIVAAELAGGIPTMDMPIETGEAVEAYETIRGFDQQIKDAGDPRKERVKRIRQLQEAITKQGDESGAMAREIRTLEAEIDIEGDPNGNLIFAQYLRLIAILARKDGEKLPANDGDRERWIQSRMIHLQEIDTKTALDVDFFLAGLLTLSGRTHPVITSLILPLFALAAATQSKRRQSGKPTIAQYRTRKKSKSGLVGVRSLPPSLKGGGLIIPK